MNYISFGKLCMIALVLAVSMQEVSARDAESLFHAKSLRGGQQRVGPPMNFIPPPWAESHILQSLMLPPHFARPPWPFQQQQPYRVVLNCLGFAPNSINASVVNGEGNKHGKRLIVIGVEGHEHAVDDFNYQSFRKSFTLPENLEFGKMKSYMV